MEMLLILISIEFHDYFLVVSSRASGGGVGVYTPPINENFSLLPEKRGKFFSKFYPISLKNSYTPPPQSWGPRAATACCSNILVVFSSGFGGIFS